MATVPARLRKLTTQANCMRPRCFAAVKNYTKATICLPQLPREAPAASSATATYDLMTKVHGVLHTYCALLLVCTMYLVPIAIALGLEVLATHAKHLQGTRSQFAPTAAVMVTKAFRLVSSLLQAVQELAAANNVKARQLQVAGEEHIEIVQMELENHKHAAAAYQESADSPDIGTAKAAIPTAGLVGATGSSMSTWLASQAAYTAARSTFTGWLFGVAAPATFAATVLPLALPAAVAGAYTGYRYWCGKQDREDARDQARKETQAIAEKNRALIIFTARSLSALYQSLVVPDDSAIHGQAISTLAADCYNLVAQLAEVHGSFQDTDVPTRPVRGAQMYSKTRRTRSSGTSASTSSTTTSSSSTSSDSSWVPSTLHELSEAQQTLQALSDSWHEIKSGAVAIAAGCGVSADSDLLQQFLQQEGAVAAALAAHGIHAETAAKMMLSLSGAGPQASVIDALLQVWNGASY